MEVRHCLTRSRRLEFGVAAAGEAPRHAGKGRIVSHQRMGILSTGRSLPERNGRQAVSSVSVDTGGGILCQIGIGVCAIHTQFESIDGHVSQIPFDTLAFRLPPLTSELIPPM